MSRCRGTCECCLEGTCVCRQRHTLLQYLVLHAEHRNIVTSASSEFFVRHTVQPACASTAAGSADNNASREQGMSYIVFVSRAPHQTITAESNHTHLDRSQTLNAYPVCPVHERVVLRVEHRDRTSDDVPRNVELVDELFHWVVVVEVNGQLVPRAVLHCVARSEKRHVGEDLAEEDPVVGGSDGGPEERVEAHVVEVAVDGVFERKLAEHWTVFLCWRESVVRSGTL